VVVGAGAYLGAAVVLGARHARRAAGGRREPPPGRAGPTGPASGPGPGPEPPDGPSSGVADRSAPEPFRGRLHTGGRTDLPHRHLRTVNVDPGPVAGPGDEIHPGERPGEQEEDVDGPDPGGNR